MQELAAGLGGSLALEEYGRRRFCPPNACLRSVGHFLFLFYIPFSFKIIFKNNITGFFFFKTNPFNHAERKTKYFIGN